MAKKPKAKAKTKTKTKPKTKTKARKPAPKPARKKTAPAKKKTTVKKKVAKKKAVKARVAARKTGAARSKTARKKPARRKVQTVGLAAVEPKRPRGRSGALAGDLQGLPRVERADSESVAELLEEGNTYEAEAISGVEAADLSDGEVHTHEVPEDDVPGEYQDEN